MATATRGVRRPFHINELGFLGGRDNRHRFVMSAYRTARGSTTAYQGGEWDVVHADGVMYLAPATSETFAVGDQELDALSFGLAISIKTMRSLAPVLGVPSLSLRLAKLEEIALAHPKRDGIFSVVNQ